MEVCVTGVLISPTRNGLVHRKLVNASKVTYNTKVPVFTKNKEM